MHISFLNQKKKIVEWICGNGIAKIGGKKNCCNWFVAMPLPKMEGKKNSGCRNLGRIKKKNAMSTIFLQQITCDQFLIISSNLNLTLRLLF